MKAKYLVIPFVVLFLLLSCDLFNTSTTGTLVLKGVKTFPTSALSKTGVVSVPAGSYQMHTIDAKFNFKEIYVSTSLADSGIVDTFDWILIGVDDTLKSIYEVDITANNLSEGIYKSLKLVFGNEFLRYAVYASDTSRTVEMLSGIAGGVADTSEVINYFSENGSFNGLAGGRFQPGSPGESFAEFQITAGQTTTIYWLMGDPTIHWTEFGFTWDDVDSNLTWTPGVDATRHFWGPAGVPMWSFLVVEE